MHTHDKTDLKPENKSRQSDKNIITLEDGIQIYFSNTDFLQKPGYIMT